MKTLYAVITLLLLCNANGHATQSVAPDVQTTIKVSNRDVNRFACPGTMQDMIYSKEKNITGHFSKSDAFIKFKITQTGTEKQYATEENELFLVCDGNVYTIITEPTDMPSTTVHLIPPAGDSFKQNVAMFKNMPLEKQALHIIRQAFDDQYPSSYKVAEVLQRIIIKPDLDVLLQQYVDVEGIGLRLKRYKIISIATEDIRVEETDFLRSDVSLSLLAVAIENHTLQPGESTRVFVVEKKEGVR
jgi:conjugal transfer pilus assembly protein TraK